MYTMIQRYTFDPQVGAALVQAMETRLVPLLKQMPYFVAYYWLDNDQGAGTALCIFEEKAAAEISLELTAAFVQEQLTAAWGAPEVICGQVKIHAVCTL